MIKQYFHDHSKEDIYMTYAATFTTAAVTVARVVEAVSQVIDIIRTVHSVISMAITGFKNFKRRR